MSTRKITRPADVPAAVAKRQIKEGGLELVSLQLVDKRGRRVAAANALGRTDLEWEATVKVAEFPFSEDGPKDDEPKGEGPKDDAPKDDKPADDPFGGDDEPADEPKGDKEPSISEVLDLVKQIAEKVGVPVDGGLDEDPLAPGGPEGDVDPLGGGDLPPAPEEDPLPLPVEKKAPGGVFASLEVSNPEAIAGRRSFVAAVADAHLLNDGEIVAQAQAAFPGYRVAGRIDRVTLASDHEARVPLIAEAKAR